MADDDDTNDIEAKRLADYSEAVRRGQLWNDRGIDPRDAEVIRQLHALGSSYMPSSKYFERAQRPKLQGSSGASPSGASQSAADAAVNPLGGSGQFRPPSPVRQLDPTAAAQGFAGGSNFTEEVGGSSGRRWDTFWKVLAAALVLFIGVGAIALLIFAIRDGDNSAKNIAAPGSTATSHLSSTETVVSLLPATPPATPTLSAPEYVQLYPKRLEISSVGPETPTSDNFWPMNKTLKWDGTGRVVISGCPDRACDFGLDDEIKITVTNDKGTQGPAFFEVNGTENGESRAFPVVLTEIFRPGDNEIHAYLIDREGDKRGTLTPVYIVVLQ